MYSAPTPKRHYAFSNSREIHRLDKGKLTGWKKSKVQTVRQYVGADGKQRYVGTKHLRPTQPLASRILPLRRLMGSTPFPPVLELAKCCETMLLGTICALSTSAPADKNKHKELQVWGFRHYPVKFALALVDVFEGLRSNKFGVPFDGREFPPAIETFQQLGRSELDWSHCGLAELYAYLRGGKHLQIPPEWRPLVPYEI